MSSLNDRSLSSAEGPDGPKVKACEVFRKLGDEYMKRRQDAQCGSEEQAEADGMIELLQNIDLLLTPAGEIVDIDAKEREELTAALTRVVQVSDVNYNVPIRWEAATHNMEGESRRNFGFDYGKLFDLLTSLNIRGRKQHGEVASGDDFRRLHTVGTVKSYIFERGARDFGRLESWGERGVDWYRWYQICTTALYQLFEKVRPEVLEAPATSAHVMVRDGIYDAVKRSHIGPPQIDENLLQKAADYLNSLAGEKSSAADIEARSASTAVAIEEAAGIPGLHSTQ